MAGAFSQVDLSQLQLPDAVETLSFDDIKSGMLADLAVIAPGLVLLESDPAMKILEVAAYRELLWRQRGNDAVRAVMPAYAGGADLDNLAATFGVSRLTITAADPTTNTPAVMESDDDFRRRLVLAPEGYSVAGPEGAYVYLALTSDPDVMDASVASPDAGEVLITLLSRTGNGTASAALIAAAQAFLSDGTRRPLTDFVTVQSAAIVNYTVAATVTTFAGPDSAVVLAAGRERLNTYIAQSHRLGRDITHAGIISALAVPGVQNVVVSSPAADLSIADYQAAYCTDVAVTYGGVGE